jgi:hypothetical protein
MNIYMALFVYDVYVLCSYDIIQKMPYLYIRLPLYDLYKGETHLAFCRSVYLVSTYQALLQFFM